METSPERRHWIVDVVRRANVPGADELVIPPGVPAAEAWRAVLERTELTSRELSELVADRFRLEVADLSLAEPRAIRLVPASLAAEHGVFPLREDYHRLIVATCDPTDMAAEQALQFASGRNVVFAVAAPKLVEEGHLFFYSPDRRLVQALRGGEDADGLQDSIRHVEEEVKREVEDEMDLQQGPVAKLTDLILAEALRSGASDIHLEPTSLGGVIRYRVDGILRTITTMPVAALSRVVSRVKIMGKLDISDRLRPQDGRARLTFDNRFIDLRISTVPTRRAEKAVIRILDPSQVKSLEEVGFRERELRQFRSLIHNRDGIVLVTGPTGSGKTTTVYAALREISVDDINIMTVEDPVEFELPGMTQIQVEPRQKVTFASALRAILRQDPDVIFVGEIRDLETAAMAVQASQTGHLVIATLHTNDAPGTIKRLADLGLDKPSINETLRGAVSQRLVRVCCPDCSVDLEAKDLSEREIELSGKYGVKPRVRAVGCPKCAETGYRGRIPLMQVMTMSPALRKLVNTGGTPDQFARTAAEAGMMSLQEVGIEAVESGSTTLEELDRVLGEAGVRRDEAGDEVEEVVDVESPEDFAAPRVTVERNVLGPAEITGNEIGEDAPEVGVGNGVPLADSGAAAPGEEEDDRVGPAARILVVDDDPPARFLTRAILEVAGYEVEEVADGAEALEYLERRELPDLMVLDLTMPRMNGEETLLRIRSSERSEDLPVVVLTGSTDLESEIRLVEAGADDYVRKPLNPRLFTGRVRAALRRGRAS